ncbi:MAG: peroxiredoxin [Synechococcaceae cyanobacterium]
MSRRQLLLSALGLASLVLPAPPAQALGGTLPVLDQPAPGFDLEGVAPAAAGLGAGKSGGDSQPTHLALADFRDRWLVLYFYPRDFTSGCTLEARGFQRDLAAFRARGADVVGVSADSPSDHAAFCGSEGLRYPLLSDPGGVVSRHWGSWLPPFSLRHTFLIDPQGILRARWTAVRPALHSQEVLAELTRLQASQVPG